MATVDHTPRGRGYDSSFGYFHHDNDYWTERLWATYNDNGTVQQCGSSAVYVDLWLAEVDMAGMGAVGMNGSKPVHSNQPCQEVDDGEGCRIPFGVNGSVTAFEEWQFAQRVRRKSPLFFCIAPTHLIAIAKFYNSVFCRQCD